MTQTATPTDDRELFLRADLLQPADVILTSDRGWSSKIVRLSTGGPYSHAILVIDVLHRLDKIGSGMQSVLATINKCEIRGDGIRWFDDISEYIRFDVYRHPQLDTLSFVERKELADRLLKFVNQWEGLEYLPERLANARTRREFQKPIKCLASIVSGFRRTRKDDESPFCSELVAMFFEEIGVKLFNQPVDPITVNPSMLSDMESNLVRRNDLKGEQDASIPHAEALHTDILAIDLELPLSERTQLVKQKVVNAHADHIAAQSLDTSAAIRKAA